MLDASKGTDLEIKTSKSKGMFMSHNRNAEQNHSIKVVNKSLTNLVRVVNQNGIHEGIKSRLNSWIACYAPVQNA